MDTRYFQAEEDIHTEDLYAHDLNPCESRYKVKGSIHALPVHFEPNDLQNAEVYPFGRTDVKVKKKFVCGTEPLTVNSDNNDIDTSELQNEQVGVSVDEGDNSESSQETDTLQIYEKCEYSRKKLLCNVCQETFPSAYKLKKHMPSHTTCVVCDKMFRKDYLYESHMRDHAGEQTPYWCDLCEKKFSTRNQLRAHRYIHVLKGEFDCSVCGTIYSRRDTFETHMKLHVDPEKNKCEVCGKQSATKYKLRQHKTVHQDQKAYHCVVCDKGFKFKYTLNYHMKSHPDKERKKIYKYDNFNMSSQCNGEYENHMNILTDVKPFASGVGGMTVFQLNTKQRQELIHRSPSRKINRETKEQRTQNIALSYDCNHCFLSYTRQIYLDRHLLRSHQVAQDIGMNVNQNMYICRICEKSCAGTIALNSHLIETHCSVVEASQRFSNGKGQSTTGEKTASDTTVYKCKICKQKVTPNSVSSHVKNHGDRRYVCRVCGMTFYKPGNHLRHMRVHTGENPFECTECGKKFRILDSLKKHKDEHVSKRAQEKKYGRERCGKMFVNNYPTVRPT